MKHIMKENMEYLKEMLMDIGLGLLTLFKGTVKTVYAILIFWCAIWVAAGNVLCEAFSMLCNWYNYKTMGRHYGKGA